LDSAEKILKYARDCIEKAVDDHWALVKQQKGNDERNKFTTLFRPTRDKTLNNTRLNRF